MKIKKTNKNWNVGKDNPFYGRKHTEESLQKMRKRKSIETIKKMTGRKHSKETIEKISKSRIGELNPIWKGDEVGRQGLHTRLIRTYGKPDNCDICKKQKPLDLANISGNYLTDIKDWQWLCRKCHMESDGRMKNLTSYRKKELS